MLDRALEIATDFVDAAGPEHRLVAEMIATNDRRVLIVDGRRLESSNWRSSAIAVFELAQRNPDSEWVADHLRIVVGQVQALAADLGMAWIPPPQLLPPRGD